MIQKRYWRPLVATLVLSIITMSGSTATSTAADERRFRNNTEGDWYHPIEVGEWVEQGGQNVVIHRILNAISKAKGPRRDAEMPDTLLKHGPGNWIYEWKRAGDNALKLARTQQSFAHAKSAVLYYHLASSPHTNDPKQLQALELAKQAYLLAGELLEYDIKEISIAHDDNAFGAYVHIPKGDGPFPVLISSNGSDQSKELLLNYFLEFLAPQGIALVSVDVPGMGGSAAFDMRDGKTEKMHLAAVRWVSTDSRFDQSNIFVQGDSFGGQAAARSFLQSEEYNLAGVVMVCAPLESPFKMPAEAYSNLPAFTIDGVRARLGLEAGSDLKEFAERIRPIALSHGSIHEARQISTLLTISTTQDPVAPLEDLDEFLKRADNKTRVVLDEEGHCPDSVSSDLIAAHWITKNLRKIEHW